MGKIDQYGLVCLSSVDDYMNDRIKKHEYTRPAKEEDRIQHMYTTEPIQGRYSWHTAIFLNSMTSKKSWCASNKPDFSFTSEDEVLHEGWKIEDRTVIDSITSLFSQGVEQTYIADGHHRSAASAKVGLRMQQETSERKDSYDSFLSVLFDENELDIWDPQNDKRFNGYNPTEF